MFTVRESKDSLTKCCEIFHNTKSGRYLFVCYHCGDTNFDTFETIKIHIEEHLIKKDEKSIEECAIKDEDGDHFADNDGESEISCENEEGPQENILRHPVLMVEALTSENVDLETVDEKSVHDKIEVPEDPIERSEDSETVIGLDSLDNADYECESCDMQFSDFIVFKMHKLLNHLKVEDTYECYFCNVIGRHSYYNKKDLFFSHLRKAHKSDYELTKPKAFSGRKCTICLKVLTNKTVYRMHMESHQDLKLHKCTICNTSYNNKKNLSSHLKRMHTNVQEFQCDICDKIFRDKGNLSHHMKTHTGEKPFKCEICNCLFTANSSLKLHLVSHTGLTTVCQCNVCGKGFKSLGKLNTHIKITHDPNSKKFKCSMCEKKFYTEHLRKKHELLHAGVRPYKCDVCGKDFRTSDVRKQHSFIHNSEKRFKCRYCDMLFAQNAGRRCHEKSRHIVD